MRAAEVTLTGEQRTTLRSWLAAGKTEWRLAFRAQIILAQIILALADGLTNKEAAGRLATRPATVSKWRGRLPRHRFAGGARAPRRRHPTHHQPPDDAGNSPGLDSPPPRRLRQSHRPPAPVPLRHNCV